MLFRADPSRLKSAYLSKSAQEPVLLFYSPADAAQFRALYRNGRIFDHDRAKVYLPRPRNLVGTRVAARGDFAFVFPTREDASAWNESVYGVGKMFEFDKVSVCVGGFGGGGRLLLILGKNKPEKHRTVYMGRATL